MNLIIIKNYYKALLMSQKRMNRMKNKYQLAIT